MPLASPSACAAYESSATSIVHHAGARCCVAELRWLRGDEREKERIVADFGRMRFGDHVHTDDPGAITGAELKWGIIDCCGQEKARLLRCHAAGLGRLLRSSSAE